MIVRISSVVVARSHAARQIDVLRKTTIPIYRAASGFVSLKLLQRAVGGHVEILVISLWQSEKAADQFVEHRLLNDAAIKGTIQFEARTYELIEVTKGPR